MHPHRVVILASLMLLTPLLAAGDAPPKRIAKRSEPAAQYTQSSVDAYGEGYAFIERATRLEHDAQAALTGSQTAGNDRLHATSMSEARLAYEDALAAFDRALQADPRMYEAHTYVGYANRKLGRYEAALSAYETALRLKPDYAHAIEYQGEAYLGLDRFADARLNYLRLYALDRQQAQKLLGSMHRWVDERRTRTAMQSEALLAEASAWLEDQPGAEVTANPQAPW